MKPSEKRKVESGKWKAESETLFANHLHQYTLPAPAIEFAVENLLPGAEIELALGNRHHDLSAHDLPFVVGIGVVLTGPIVVIALWRRIERGQFLQPYFVVAMQAGFIIVDKHAGGNVHRIDKAKPLANPALGQASFDLRSDVYQIHPLGDLEP